ncbi:Cysteine sulfinate desulfinase [Leclercia adecarboxylata]|uniref:Cysteine sulfinate desulfinase n=1 Tax=Leclercia adecarboxylata TaxID=83655 RepID=A0A4U9IJT3_9ENTR|nr:Cysteine sulfinate desulfinase [Leclercia adecarboxylata]
MNAFSPAHFRAQFPALADAGVYLDSAATALKPQAVIDATQQFYSLSAGNVHRSQFAEAQRLTARYEAARDQVAQLLNAESGKNIVWTRGTTEAINMVAQCYARPRLQPGDEIIVSEAEHHANLVPWLMVAEQTGARVVKLPPRRRFLSRCYPPSRIDYPAQPHSRAGADVQRHRRLPRIWPVPSSLLMPAAWW